ncbi:hypothetical protein D3C87_1620930 [compost metagenome]
MNTMSLSGRPRVLGKIKPSSDETSPASRSCFASRRICAARAERGTLCRRPAFIRSSGIFQQRPSRSISDHNAPRVSPERAAVSTVNSSASFTIAEDGPAATSLSTEPTRG